MHFQYTVLAASRFVGLRTSRVAQPANLNNRAGWLRTVLRLGELGVIGRIERPPSLSGIGTRRGWPMLNGCCVEVVRWRSLDDGANMFVVQAETLGSET